MPTPPDIIRLWKDEEYRKRLTGPQRQQFEEESARLREAIARLPGNPAGPMEELSDNELRQAVQAARPCTKYASISTTWCDNPEVC
jgi:mersacidin/lichenicidin family type 2 lantibiotic